MNDFYRFNIVKFLDDGLQHIDCKGMFCLPCLTDQGERLVLWGSDGGDLHNINTTVKQALPFYIECQVIEPPVAAMQKYGDLFWVDEEEPLAINSNAIDVKKGSFSSGRRLG